MIVGKAQERVDGWFVRNAVRLRDAFRITVGLVWILDGSLKFAPGFVDAFTQNIASLGDGQPSWLQGWFTFWSNLVSSNPAAWVYTTGTFELTLGLGLVFGFLRKIAYGGGLLLSLFIWGVPEGFGGPYGPGSTDLGTGIVYAFVFVALMVLDATYGPSRFSLDWYFEKRWKNWSRVAEIRGFQAGPVGASTESAPAAGSG